MLTENPAESRLADLQKRVQELESSEKKWRETAQRLQDFERRYQTMFENTGTATIIIDEDFTVTSINSNLPLILGYPKAELVGRKWIDFVHPEDLDLMKRNHIARRVSPESAPKSYEFRLLNNKGEIRHIFLTIDIIPGTTQSLASLIDITDLKHSEEALRLSEEMFSKAFRASPSFIFIANLKNLAIINANDSFLKTIGYRHVDEVFGKSLIHMNFFHDPMVAKRLRNRISTKGRMRAQEFEFCTRTGEIRMGILSAERIELWNEPCLLAAIEDITDIKNLERELIKISEKERRKIGHLLHDDIAPHLIGIEAISKVLCQLLEKKSPKAISYARKISPIIQDAIVKIRHLSRGLYPVHLVDRGLEESLKEYTLQVQDIYNLPCNFICDPSFQLVDNTVATHLFFIAQEAIQNALKHAGTNWISIFLGGDESHMFLKIEDNGRGFSETKKKTGIGLNIMKYRARLINADFDIQTSSNSGTKITVTLAKTKTCRHAPPKGQATDDID